MELRCSACGAPITAEGIHLEMAIARCSSCSAVMDLAGRGQQQVGRTAATLEVPEVQRTRVPMPEGFSVAEEAGVLRIRWRWFSPKHLFLLFFCIAWDSFLVFWYATALQADDTPWLMVVFPIAHLAVGVGLTYTTIAQLVNRTTVELERGMLHIRHHPVPWLGNRSLPASEITQLYCQERVAHRHRGDGERRTVITYDVSAVLRGGRQLKLLRGLADLDQALYLEQQLERRLRIADARVPGEVRVA